jgi:hypothetical protein
VHGKLVPFDTRTKKPRRSGAVIGIRRRPGIVWVPRRATLVEAVGRRPADRNAAVAQKVSTTNRMTAVVTAAASTDTAMMIQSSRRGICGITIGTDQETAAASLTHFWREQGAADRHQFASSWGTASPNETANRVLSYLPAVSSWEENVPTLQRRRLNPLNVITPNGVHTFSSPWILASERRVRSAPE